ncbi:MAG: hypothetical protein CBC35_03540 [Planctomycetes bacterium TMED75]|nr:hypothetical protein [Planctomycetaceae bacterium]OUU94700.1 MAG: hypothetical protein CBC35_03540 [Planctomycetes bacterium TMED75]
MITSLLLAALMAGPNATSATTSEDLSVACIASKESFFFVEVSNVRGMMDRLAATSLGKMVLDGKTVNDLLEPFRAEQAEELGVKPEEITLPIDMGFAVYTVLDEEFGVEIPAWLAYAEWKDSDEEVKAIFENQIERMELKYDEERLRGRDMLVIETDLEMPDMDEFMADAMPMAPMMGDSSHMADALKKIFVVRDGSMIVMCSEPVGIDQAFKVIDGGSADTLADAEAFKNLEDMIDGDPDIQAGLLTGPLGAMVKPLAGPGFGMALPVIQQAFGDISGWGFWGQAAPEGNLFTFGQNIAFNGGPQGLMKLFDVATPMGTIPSFVSAEALNYGRFNFDFKNLIPTLNQIIAALPEAQAQQIQQMAQMWGPMLQTSLETLGPAVHTFSSESDDEFNPMRTTLAIPTTDPKKVDQLIAMFGPMAGMQPRDFNGDTIYTDPMDDMGTVAIGVGAGSLLIGQVDGVEAVLRSAGQNDLPALARTKVAEQAERAMAPGDLLTWGFWDVKKLMLMADSPMEMMPAPLAQAHADNPEDSPELMSMLSKAKVEEVAALVGPYWTMGRSTKNGMQFQFGLLIEEK